MGSQPYILSVGRSSTPEYIHQTGAYLFRNIFFWALVSLALKETVGCIEIFNFQAPYDNLSLLGWDLMLLSLKYILMKATLGGQPGDT